MSRPKNIFNNLHIEQLLNLVAQAFGKPLTHSFECETLSKDIKKVTGMSVSSQTLRRLFGFLKADFSPSVKTLNSLAAYSGFPNWHYFTENSSSIIYKPLTMDQEAEIYLSFYKIEMKKEEDMNYHNASRNIAFRILFSPSLLSKLSSSLAKNPVSQVYFFERFPYIDGLGGEYKRGIQLYLQKKETDAQIFGTSLLFLSAFLCGKPKELKIYNDRINQFSITETMHPFTIARYIGSNILYAYFKNEHPVFWIGEVNKWNKYFLLKKNTSFWHYPYFQHMIADYLNLAGFFKESYLVIRTVKHSNQNYEIEQGYEEALNVIYEIAHHTASRDDYSNWMRSTNVFFAINPLFKKLYELQALCVYRSILANEKKKGELSLRINELISQTGFTYFTTHLL